MNDNTKYNLNKAVVVGGVATTIGTTIAAALTANSDLLLASAYTILLYFQSIGYCITEKPSKKAASTGLVKIVEKQ